MGTQHHFLRATAGEKSHQYESVINHLGTTHNQTTATQTTPSPLSLSHTHRNAHNLLFLITVKAI